MNLGSGAKSMSLFGLSVLFLVLITVFESALSGLSPATERGISMALLVLPGLIGVTYGVVGALRKEPRVWIAYLGVLLNAVFSLFHIFVLSFAG